MCAGVAHVDLQSDFCNENTTAVQLWVTWVVSHLPKQNTWGVNTWAKALTLWC